MERPATPSERRPLSVRAARTVIAVALLFLAVAGGVVGGDVEESLSSGGFEDPASESERASVLLDERFDQGGADLVVIASTEGSPVSAPDATAAGLALAADLRARDGVEQVVDYWSLGAPAPLASNAGDRALLLVRLAGDDAERLDRGGELVHELGSEWTAEGASLDLAFSGPTAVFSEVNEVVEEDLVRAELLAFPVTFVLLVLVFGTVVSALLPLAIGAFAIAGTFLGLELLAGVTEISIFALNFTTALGLGLAIDYALLVVSRHREELAAGHAPRDAVQRTLRTAGRTVVFSGLTVASALVALLVFPFAFLRSFAYAGVLVVGLAVIGATVVLPALLTVLGDRVNRLRVRTPRVRTPDEAADGAWHRLAMFVMRRPIPVAAVASVLLLVLAVPFGRVQLGFPDDRVLPEGSASRVAGDVLREDFAAQEASATFVVLPDATDADDGRAAALDAYAAELSTVDGVARVEAVTGFYAGGALVAPAAVLPDGLAGGYADEDGAWLRVVGEVEPVSPEGEALVADVRAVEVAPGLGDAFVGGRSAELLDGTATLTDRLPFALALIGLITFVVLFMSFGSLLMPIKAIVLNLLSLTATLGAIVWVFQDGRFEDLLGFTATGTITTTMPILLFCLAFGLSMDYEVFLLSRIKEEHDRTGDDVLSVARGLESTGRIVTAAAVLIAVVFVAFGVTGRVSFMVLFGLGMTLAVLVDAFIVRSTLVPAFMRLAGAANWWAPAPLRRFHEAYGFSEHGGSPSPTSSPTGDTTGEEEAEHGTLVLSASGSDASRHRASTTTGPR